MFTYLIDFRYLPILSNAKTSTFGNLYTRLAHNAYVLNDLKIAINPLINQNVALPMSESFDSYADCKSSCGLIQKMCLVEPSWFHL